MLFSPLMALPSGGKFTHGTSGTITSGNGHMQINGKETNSVIQWGGGFSIGKGESVNFGGNSKNYLNIAHGTSKSTIEGVLNAKGNNVFLINPNGVIITKTGTINANRFVASTSSLNENDYKNFFSKGAAFSPVFKANKLGNVVNMGTINSDNILLIGNKVKVEGSIVPLYSNGNMVNLVGNEIDILLDNIKAYRIVASAYEKGELRELATSAYYDSKITDAIYKFKTQEYNNIENLGNKKLVTDDFQKYIGIGSDLDWFYFSKMWNESKTVARFNNDYRLVNDIYFENKNYANYCISGHGCANMIIGYDIVFAKNFDGQGFALNNINIDTTILKDKIDYVGVFGRVGHDARIKNIKIDYNLGGIKTSAAYAGGFAGEVINNAEFSNISLNRIEGISANHVGGFVGIIRKDKQSYPRNPVFSKIELNNIKNIGKENSRYVGGFTGYIVNGTFNDITLNNIENIKGDRAGGFVGYINNEYNQYKDATIKIQNISLNNVKNIGIQGVTTYSGGFAGEINYGDFSNISLNNVGNIYGNAGIGEYYKGYAGGFAGYILKGNYSNISLNIFGDIIGNHAASGFGTLFGFQSRLLSNIYMYFQPDSKLISNNYLYKFVNSSSGLNNINIYHKEGELTNAEEIPDKMKIYTYTDENGYINFKEAVLGKLEGLREEDGNLIFAQKPDINIDIEKPSEDVVLEKDDVVSIKDLQDMLDVISNGKYSIHIKNPDIIYGITDSIRQSLDFLKTLYAQEKISEILENIDVEYKNIYNKYQDILKLIDESKISLNKFISGSLKPLIQETENFIERLIIYQGQLNDKIAEYNDYVDLINQGLANKNDEYLDDLKKDMNMLINASKNLADKINKNQEQLIKWKEEALKQSQGHFEIKGAFANVILNTNLDLNEIDPPKPIIPPTPIEPPIVVPPTPIEPPID
ncbi:filamentous hemagglutinin N-terminal domain-containing protein, partial [Campylobacter sp. IFREMER_LSEM_CL2090]|uniref:two-partner secretion domain-containing protein n=1 Tax=Campylobacter sp. IFREMER_LSEM_CL2090 TaxID=2911617 RepID=UPI0021E74969